MVETTTSPATPVLGMLVDRTSFDETDDYGIDRDAIVDNVPVGKLNAPASTILKNGRVRRRLRWRPKRRNDGCGSLEVSDDDSRCSYDAGLIRTSSSNVSVNSHSNMSHCSRVSNRSAHSFSSTQTMQRDNTKDSGDRARRFPLPRPNYPKSFDGVATIGNEATMIHARIKGGRKSKGSSGTVFAAVDLDNIDATTEESGEDDHPEIRRSSSTSKKRGFPPLFRRIPRPPMAPRKRTTSTEELNSGSATPPMSPRSLKSAVSEPMPMHTPSQSPSFANKMSASQPSTPTTTNTQAELSTPLPPAVLLPKADSSPLPLPPDAPLEDAPLPTTDDLPAVEMDPLDTDRRVDLRIPEHRQADVSRVGRMSETGGSIRTCTSQVCERKPLSALVPHKIHPLKWSQSDSAIASSASVSCVEFLLAADPEDIKPAVEAPEVRFSMSEVGNAASEPIPSPKRVPSRLFISRSSSGIALKPLLSPSTPKYNDTVPAMDNPISPSRLPAPPSFSLDTTPETVNSDQTTQPLSPTEPTSPYVEDKPDESSDSSPSSAPVDVSNGAFLDVEKNLQAIHNMGIEHLSHKEYPEALEVFEEILRGQLTRYGEEHYRVGTALHNIGIVHMKQGDYEEAAHVSYEAVRIRRLSLPADHPDIAVSLAQLGVALLECRKFKKAIAQFREALRIRRRCYGPKHLKVAKLLNNIGCALYELNELEVAKVAFEEALDIQRSTLREVPLEELEEPANQILLSIASTLSNIGSIKLYWGQNGEASIDLEEALLIQQSVLGDEHPFARRTEDCLEWMESRGADSIDESDENSVVAVLSSDADKKEGGSMLLCTSSAHPVVDQPQVKLRQMMDQLHRNLWTFRSNLELTCQGGDTFVQEFQKSGDNLILK